MIGAGYVGLVSAACFSEFGWSVSCVDKDPSKIESLRQGGVPIYEPRLEELLQRNLRMGRITFASDLASSIGDADLVFLAVGTPMRRGDGHADLSFVFQAVEDLAPHLEGFTVIATKSTVPVGTSREIERRLKKLRPEADFAVCSNPEFLREGSAIYDFMHPDRVLVGCDDPRAQDLMERLYKPLALRNAPVMFVSRESAELAKYAGNAFLAMKISFVNEIAVETFVIPEELRIFVTTGMMGGLTTYSTFSYETVRLVQTGAWTSAWLNVVLTTAAALVLCVLGMAAGRMVIGLR